jgi:Flp pilus assembly protein TadG
MMKELITRLKSNRDGAAATEFAIILPVLLLILMGLIDFAMALHTKNTLQYAVERAARYAIVNQSGSTGSFSTEVTTHLAGILDDTNVTITVTPQSADGMNFVFIEASQTYNFTLPFVSYLGGINVAGNTRVPLVEE